MPAADVRGSNRTYPAGPPVPFGANIFGDQLVSGGRTAPFTEMTRNGNAWSVTSAAVTPLVVIPTTTCSLELFNNTQWPFEVIDLFLFHLLGTAAIHNLSLWAEATTVKAIPALSAQVVGSMSGKPPYTATLGTDLVPAAGTTVVAAGWRPFGAPNVSTTSTALPGEAFSVAVDGKIIVPPKCSLAIAVVDALATGSSAQVGATVNFLPGLVME